MAWNKPGGEDKEHDPWGGNKKNQSPPDIDKIIADLVKKFRGFFNANKPNLSGNGSNGSNNNSGWQLSSHKEIGYMAGIVAAIIVVVWFLSGFFIVNPAEQAVVLRLGQYSETMDPGLHWMARFIDVKYVVDVQKINSFSLQGDYLTKSAEQSDLPNQVVASDLKKANDQTSADLLDKSKNLVNVELTVQYRIRDPRSYLFNTVDPDDTIHEVAAGALSEVVGKMKLDDVLTTGRELLSSGVLERTKQVLLAYNVGLEVVAVTLRKVQAPDQVQAAFNDVNRADQDKATYIQQAQAYASKVVPLAQGVAARISADATAYQFQSVLVAQSEVARFTALLTAYKVSPELMRERMYLETIQGVFENTTKVLIDTGSSNNMLYLPIDKMIQSSKYEMSQQDETISRQTATNLSIAQAGDSSKDQSQLNGPEVKQ